MMLLMASQHKHSEKPHSLGMAAPSERVFDVSASAQDHGGGDLPGLS
jgi:hypothetical protein